MTDGVLFCIASSAVVPLRKQPREQAEMVNQCLLGEISEVLSIDGRWVEVVTEFDNYHGWVSKNQVILLNQTQKMQYVSERMLKRSPFATFRVHNKIESRMVPPGALVDFGEEEISIHQFTGKPETALRSVKGNDIIETAMFFLGTPYLWGGRTDFGIDCSGLVQTVYLLHDVALPRDSSQQAQAKPYKSNDIKDAEKGDLIYFAFDGGGVSHVGFYVGNGTLLHASASVCLQNIDPRKRFENPYPLNNRLSEAIVGIQSPFSPKESF